MTIRSGMMTGSCVIYCAMAKSPLLACGTLQCTMRELPGGIIPVPDGKVHGVKLAPDGFGEFTTAASCCTSKWSAGYEKCANKLNLSKYKP